MSHSYLGVKTDDIDIYLELEDPVSIEEVIKFLELVDDD